MVASAAELERPLLKMGSVSFIAGLAIALVSTLVFHPTGTGEELMNNHLSLECMLKILSG